MNLMYHSLRELLDLAAARLTPEELMQVLDMDMYDLVELLEDEINRYRNEVEDAVS